MKLKLITVLMLMLLLIGTLTVAFNIPPIMADTGTASAEGNYPPTQKAETSNGQIQAGSHNNSQNQNLSSKASQEGNSEPVAKDKCDYNETEKRSDYQWNLDETNEWAEFANVDGDSAELIIGVNDAEPNNYDEITRLITENGGNLVSTVSMGGKIRAVVADIPLVAVSSFVTEVQAAGLSRYIEPNMKFQAIFVPNDPYWPQQWGPQKIEADYAWDTTVGDPSVLVAVIDTGIDWDHPDLTANYVPLGYDWVNDDPNPMDDNGHGTHCAGIIAAVINNSIGIAGLAQVCIMAEKGLDAGGWGTEDDLARAIVHAVDCGADILSNSWGGYGESALIHEAVKYAYDRDVLVVAAAGNEAWDVKLYPAGYDEVVAVTATDQYDDPAWFTNYGEWVELAAPGVDIYSTVWDNSYTYKSGTSMSTPHVAGVAALVWSCFPGMSRDWMRLWLRCTADDLGDPGFDVYYGYGRVNARKAVEETPPDHDLLISNWERAPYVEPGMLATINTTVLNFGASNETDVAVQLLVNGGVVDSTLIGFLATGESATVSCSWSPTVEGMYNLTSFVVPVLNETITENNVVWAYVFVGFPLKAFVLQSAGTYSGDIISNWQVLNTNWYKFGDTMIYIDYTTLNIDDITYDDIAAAGADVLIISCAYAWEFTDSEIGAITRYIREGHGLIATAGTLYSGVPNNNKLAPLFGLSETITWDGTWTDLLHIVNITHPLFFNVPNPYCFPELGTALPSDGRWDSNELAGGTYVALGHHQESALVVYRGLVYISPWLEIIPAYYHHHLQLLYNAITWSSYERPEHELIVRLESPPTLRPGNLTILNATVYNMGLSNETDVELQLLVDGSIVDSVTIPELLVGSSYTLDYLWTPTVEGTYNVTAYAPPLPGEEIMENNVESASVLVYYMMVALFKNVDPWGIPSNEEALSLYRIPYVVFGSKDFGSVDLTPFLKVVIASDQDQTFYYAMDDYRWWFEDYVSNGGLLEIHAADWGWHGGRWVGTLPGGLQWVSHYANYVTIIDPTHPFVTMPNLIVDPELDYWGWSVHGYFTNYTAGSRVVIIEDYSGCPAYLEFQYGAGFILASSQTLEWAYMHRYSLILENSLLYCKFPHDLAVFLEAPTYVPPSDSTLLNATVYNLGLSSESDVELRLLINGRLVNSVVIPELVSGSCYTLSYMWTPMVEGRYNVTAYAPPLLDKEPAMNNIDSAMVFVRFVRYVLWDDVHDNDWDSLTESYLSLYQLLSSSGFVVDELTSGIINSELLAKYDILVLIDPELDFSPSEITDIQSWVAAGGSMFVIVDTGYPPTLNTLMAPYGVQMTGLRSYYGTTTNIVSHPITQAVSSIYYDLAWEIAVTSPSTTLAWTIEDYAFLSATTIGKVVVTSDSNIMDNWGLEMADNTQLLLNIFNWLIVFREHDLAVILDAPPFVEPGVLSVLNASAQNRGLNNETDVELLLMVNGTEVRSVTIPELQAGGTYTLSYPWTPIVEATYNITAYTPPVPCEVFTVNNVVSVDVIVRSAIAYVAVLDAIEVPSYWTGGWNNDYQTLVNALIANGFYAEAVTNEKIIAGVLSRFDVFVMVDNVPNDAAVPYVYDFWSDGGSIVAFDSSICFLCYAGILPPESAGRHGYGEYWDYNTGDRAKVSTAHPVTEGYEVGQIIYGTSGDAEYRVYALRKTIAYPHYTALAEDPGNPDLAYVSAYEPLTNGRVVHIWDQLHWSNTDLQLMILNAMEWAKPRHNIAVTLDAPESGWPHFSVTLNVTVSNTGSFKETAVELLLLINGSLVASATIPELPIRSSHKMTYTWRPTVEATFNITAYAPPVPGEEHVEDNVQSKMVNVRQTHDILIHLKAESGAFTVLRATAFNKGSANETDVELYLLVNGSTVASTVITKLLVNRSYTLSYFWSPAVDGTYNITAYAPPLPDEELTANNVAMRTIYMFPLIDPASIHVKPSEKTLSVDKSFTINITVTDVVDLWVWQIRLYFDPTILNCTGASLPPNHVFAGKLFMPVEPSIEENYVQYGCSLIGAEPGFTGSGVLCQIEFDTISPGVSMLEFSRPLGEDTFLWDSWLYDIPFTAIDGLAQVTKEKFHDVGIISVTPSTTRIYPGWIVDITVVVKNWGTFTETFNVTTYWNNTLIETKNVVDLPPDGQIALTFSWNTTGLQPKAKYILWAEVSSVPEETNVDNNFLIDGIILSVIRDVAIIHVFPSQSWVYQGQLINITVVSENKGNATETFNVKTYYDDKLIGALAVINLAPNEETTITFVWNTQNATPCRNYTITAVADAVPGEVNLTDNSMTSPTLVKVRIPGDINDDGRVDMKDIATIARAFGSFPGHLRWDADLDFNNDGKIDMKDVVVVARNFGKCI